MNPEFKEKYLKYKKKYLELKDLMAGGDKMKELLFKIINPELFLRIANEDTPVKEEYENIVKVIDNLQNSYEYHTKRYGEYINSIEEDIEYLRRKIAIEDNKTLKTGSKKKSLEKQKGDLEKVLSLKKPGFKVVSRLSLDLDFSKRHLETIHRKKKESINFYKQNKFIEKTEDGKIKIDTNLFAKYLDSILFHLVDSMRGYHESRSDIIIATTPADPKNPIKMYHKKEHKNDTHYPELKRIVTPVFKFPSYLLSDEYKRIEEKNKDKPELFSKELSEILRTVKRDIEIFKKEFKKENNVSDIIIG